MSKNPDKFRPWLSRYTLTKEVEDALIHSYWDAIERLVDRELRAIEQGTAIKSIAQHDSLQDPILVSSDACKSVEESKEAP